MKTSILSKKPSPPSPERLSASAPTKKTSLLINIVTNYNGALFRYFRKATRDPCDAEDLTQEVYCKLARLEDEEALAKTENYLFRIASNVLRDKNRRDRVRMRDKSVPYDDALKKDPSPSPEQIIDGREQYGYFLKALKDLSPRAQEVFVLSRFEDLTYRQIAQRCGISVNTVKKHMVKAMAGLKAALEG